MIQPFWRYISQSYSLCPSLLIPVNIAVKRVKGLQKNRINRLEMLAIVINAIFSVKKVL